MILAGSGGTIGCVVLSYARPRMLREALTSLEIAYSATKKPDHVVLADDGSAFDVRRVAQSFILPWLDPVIFPPMSAEKRFHAARVGRLVNVAIGRLLIAGCDHITYLCDDDLTTPEWPRAAALALDCHPETHMVRGRWLVFDDGTAPTRNDPDCPMDDRQLTTGNFAHRAGCFTHCGVGWPEDTVACHDNTFLENWAIRHGGYQVGATGVLAGWRRLHKNNALNFAAGTEYVPAARAWLAQGALE